MRILTVADLKPEQLPYRVRVSLPAKDISNTWIGEAVTLHATLQPPPEPIEPGGERPDVLIEREGATAALRSEGGSLVFPPATAGSYSVDNWLLADGDERDAAAATDEGAFRCDSLGCIGTVKGKKVALIRHPGALEEDCRLADIVIAPFTIGKKCRAARVIVDRRTLKADGAHALYIEGLDQDRDGRLGTRAQALGSRPHHRQDGPSVPSGRDLCSWQ